MSGRVLRASSAPKVSTAEKLPYNEPGRLHTLGKRTAELALAVREAVLALDAGHPAVAREVLVRVTEPDAA